MLSEHLTDGTPRPSSANGSGYHGVDAQGDGEIAPCRTRETLRDGFNADWRFYL